MFSFMLNHLFNLVAGGVRTSHGFKTVHLNACAKVLNDHFKTTVTGAQVYNHNRTWKRKWQRIAKLKKLSAALWDEDKCMIVLDHEHYRGHIKVCTCWNYFAIVQLVAGISFECHKLAGIYFAIVQIVAGISFKCHKLAAINMLLSTRITKEMSRT